MDRVKGVWGLLRGLTDEELEDLVLELVKPTYPTAKQLLPPDLGLDVYVPKTPTRRVIGWQAKNYGKKIYWGECAESVERAMDCWTPWSITFVFPRRLTTKEIKKWETFHAEQLAAHDELEHLDWCDELAVLIRDREAILRRLLSEMLASDDVDELVEIALRPEPFEPAVEEHPPPAISHGATGAYTVDLDEQGTPVLQFETVAGGRRHTIRALREPGSTADRARPWFAETPRGRSALEAARRSLAHGKPIDLIGADVGVQVDDPVSFPDLDQERDLRGGRLRLEVSSPTPLTVTIIDASGDEHTLVFDAVLVPPLPGYRQAIAGVRSGVLLTLDMLPGEQGRPGRTLLASEISPVGIAAVELVGGLLFAQRFPTAELIEVRAPEPFAEIIEDRGGTCALPPDDAVTVGLEIARVAARLELLTGREFDLPGSFDSDDLRDAQVLGALLKGEVSEVVPTGAAVAFPRGAPTDLAAYASGTVWAPATLFGRPTGMTMRWVIEDGRVTGATTSGSVVAVTIVETTPVRAPRVIVSLEPSATAGASAS